MFCLPQHLESYAAEVFGRLAAADRLRGLARDPFITGLAGFLACSGAPGSCQLPSARFLRASFSVRKLASARAKVLPEKAVRRPRKVSLCTSRVPPSAGVSGGQREAVLAADDARQAGYPPQLRARVGDGDLRLDGHQAAVGRMDAAQRDPVPDGDLPGCFAEQRVPLRVAAKVGQGGPHGLRRGADLDGGGHGLHALSRLSSHRPRARRGPVIFNVHRTSFSRILRTAHDER